MLTDSTGKGVRLGAMVTAITCLCLIVASTYADTYTFTTTTLIDSEDATYDGHDIVVDGCTVTINGAHDFASLHVTSSGVVTHASNVDAQVNTLDLTIAGDVTVDADSAIDVTGRGYIREQGPGAGAVAGGFGCGAGYGGNGGWTCYGGVCGSGYGSILEPTDIGSGGGHSSAGGAGGGAIRLNVAGALTIDGVIRADGAQAGNNGGGGSGGAVWINADLITGAGLFSAVGGQAGNLNCGGGGGGRIALYADFDSFSWQTPAYGGAGCAAGGAGTAYFKAPADDVGIVVLDNNSTQGAWTKVNDEEAFSLAIRNSAIAYPTAALTLAELIVNPGSILAHSSAGVPINLTIVGDATIDPNAAVNVTGRGYPAHTGPGAGLDADGYGSGGAYGGNGGVTHYGYPGGVGYGSIVAPNDFGSGGGNGNGGPGGGLVRMNVGGVLTVNGDIIADGAAGGSNSGGGAGGGVYLVANEITGDGSISANGGDSGHVSYTGCGGGGRMALEYVSNTYTGALTAFSGLNGDRKGGAGTIYLKEGADDGVVLVDNGDQLGAWTPMTSPTSFDLTIAGGAVVYPTEPLTIDNLHVQADSYITHSYTDGSVNLTVLGDATIDLNAYINVTGRGYPAEVGDGAGAYSGGYGSGAGYGGNGGVTHHGFPGGAGYGSIVAPDEYGSGGGNATGGAGGGVVRMIVAGTLAVDGEIIADGAAAGNNGGGGSGGSIYLAADTVTGVGLISSNGGEAGSVNYTGCGAGGRIAVNYENYSFTGQITAASPPNGVLKGGAGTVLLRRNGQPGELIIDNLNRFGAWTPLSSLFAFDVTIQNGAVVYPIEALNLSNIDINDGGVMTHSTGGPRAEITVQNDMQIAVGGALNLNARGFAADTGPGAGAVGNGYASGAGYGGNGGVSHNYYAAGGPAYAMNEVMAPEALGSGGASGSSSTGGAGGGALYLNVHDLLTVNGVISADGVSGANSNCGGGSGGSLYIQAGILDGGGAITADGGDAPQYAGGGGGGRIALLYNLYTFTGDVTTFGGTGYMNGGAGSIYCEDTSRSVGELALKNNSVVGAWTPITTPASFDLVILDGAVVNPAAPLTVNNLHIAPDGLLTQLSGEPGVNLHVLGDAIIDVAGALNVNGRGLAADSGPGAGIVGSGYASGAGYGGEGGVSYRSYSAGGAAYDLSLIAAPTSLGSGGASGSSSAGGSGGGAVNMIVDGVLDVEGTISADGANGVNSNGGGGSGGSLHLTVGSLAGDGAITADGGNGGSLNAGGGGGGRIAVVCDVKNFNGDITTFGGDGSTRGGAGSVYLSVAEGSAQLIYSNDEQSGAKTPVLVPTVCDLSVASGAVAYPQDQLTVNNLHVSSGGVITHAPLYDDFFLRVHGDATIDAGGAIQADGMGFGSGAGPGAGHIGSGYASGAGHGGLGGDSFNHYAAGGSVYDMVERPCEFGSGGASGSGSTGGAGGGYMLVVVNGAMQVDGVLAVNGGVGGGANGGGGSGGGLILKVGSLDGVGFITADGGAGGTNAGGGGGGRIAILTCDLAMSTSNITAAGGLGWENGYEGTVLYGSNTVEFLTQPQDQIVVIGEPFVTFSVSAIGDGDLTYQWRYEGADLVEGGKYAGVNTDTLTVSNIQEDDLGFYYCVVTDDCGPYGSQAAVVTVAPDLDRDGDVDLSDLALLLANYGMTGAAPEDGDCNGDGVVNISDLAELLGYYGIGR